MVVLPDDPFLAGHIVRRDVLRERTLAGRAAHQLHHDSAQPRPAARFRGDGDRRPLRHALEEGDQEKREGEAQAPQESRRHPAHGPAPRRHLRRRHAQGKDCRRRGAEAQDSGHRHRGHQLRSGRSGLRDPGQRRCPPGDPPVRVADRRGSHRGGRCRVRLAEAEADRRPRRRRAVDAAARPRPRGRPQRRPSRPAPSARPGRRDQGNPRRPGLPAGAFLYSGERYGNHGGSGQDSATRPARA